MSETQSKIKTVLGKIFELRKIDRHSKNLEQELTKAKNKLAANEKKLDDEHRDIENLEKLSVKGLFYKVLGSKEEQIDKERQEYLQAALKNKEIKKQIELIEYELDLLGGKTDDIPALEKELEQLKIKRQDELIWSGIAKGKRLGEILETQDALLVSQREIKEAKLEGEASIKDINAIIAQLKKAKDWGNWDMMGKGNMAGYYKRDAMDRARDISMHAQRSLHRFERELQDVGKEFQFEINIDSINGFLEFFFDNLISDWIIQQKIKNSLANVNSVKDKVNKICFALDDASASIDAQLTDLDNEKDKLILGR